MCVIVVEPTDVMLEKETLALCEKANGDGMGFMYAEDGVVTINKGFQNFEDFWKEYEAIPDRSAKNVVSHFRIATHGSKSAENCHPFWIDDEKSCGIAHNGVLYKHTPPYGSDKTDTETFVESVIKPLCSIAPIGDVLKNEGIRALIESEIGYSKLATLDNTGNVVIFNRSEGIEHETGAWFSNDSWQKRKCLSVVRSYTRIPHGPAVYCTVCGTTLIGRIEKDAGRCAFCLKRYAQYQSEYCEECGTQLLTESEKALGSCSHCFSSKGV